MNDKFKPPRKTLRRRSLSAEPSGESSTDDEANEVERKVPYKAPLMRARPFEPFDEDDSTDSEATDSDETDNEENNVARESPNNAPRMRARAPQPSDEDDSTDSETTSPEELEVSPEKNNDAVNEPPNKKRKVHRRKMYTPRRYISPEAEVNQTDAKPCNSGESKKAPEEP